MTTGANEIRLFQPASDYHAPALPTADAIQSSINRVRQLFKKSDNPPYIADDRLQRTTADTLNTVAAPPEGGRLLEELQLSLTDWLTDPSPASLRKLIVLPPCEQDGIIQAWANTNNHCVLAPPDRTRLLSANSDALPSLEGDGLLVIPQLERWFLRHRNGLTLIRALLAQLDTLNRKCLIGCNSWAWRFLGKAVGADLALPNALTFQAYDAERLRGWFKELAAADSEHQVTLRLPENGKDVLSADEESDHGYFVKLAARSRGIPWVAWQLWRRSLRAGIEADSDDDAATRASLDADEQTLWVAALEDYSLPASAGEGALFVLQALLIHGEMSLTELRAVLPLVGESNVLATLIGAGFVTRRENSITCLAAAYPAIRANLETAGFPTSPL